MRDALIQARLTAVRLDPTAPPECFKWNGLLEFGASPNGAYPGMVPFEGMSLNGGMNMLDPPILVYDGPAGFCGAGTPDASLFMQVSASGIDGTGNPVFDSQNLQQAHKGTDPPHDPNQVYCVRLF